MQVRPHEGVSLERWSLSEYAPEPAAMPSDVNETTYFVYYSHGETPSTPWAFTLYLKVEDVLFNLFFAAFLSLAFRQAHRNLFFVVYPVVDRCIPWNTPVEIRNLNLLFCRNSAPLQLNFSYIFGNQLSLMGFVNVAKIFFSSKL